MMDWLIDTFLWTGGLIALILLIRQPVARIFGPKMAYALWSLPFLRLLMPPITLPSWMAPEEQAAEGATFTLAIPLESVSTTSASAAPIPDESAFFAPSDLLLPLWIGGAIAFLIWRWVEYRRMKLELLRDAVPVGEEGTIQLIETAEVSSPVAFGVRNKVIALPPDFIAHEDRHARDLAIAHEVQHHKAGDLIANFAAQAVLALHWFNPLAWAGWRAMRRDQEAACDARVVEQCGEDNKAAYGEVIAGFAAGPRLALAAPMACPVLGEKSVIHRLRSLNMSDVSSKRRFAGRAALLAGVVALPFTASISYAEDTEPEKVVRTVKVESPREVRIIKMAEGDSESTTVEVDNQEVEVIVLKDKDGQNSEEVRKIIKKFEDGEHSDDDANTFVWVSETEDEDGQKTKTVSKIRTLHINSDKKMTEEERDELLKKFKAKNAEWRNKGELKNEIQIAIAESENTPVTIDVRCDGEIPEALANSENEKQVIICQSKVMASALIGLEQARARIASDKSNIPIEAKDEVLRALDQEISRLKKES